MRRNACVVLAAFACSLAVAGVALSTTTTRPVKPRTLAAEARYVANHGGVISHNWGAATDRLKQLSRRLVAARFHGYALGRMDCIIERESGWNPGAISSTGDYGLAQVNYAAHHRSYDWRLILDPAYNVAVAWRLSSGGRDWSPWSGGRYAC